jgi:hypothetical protein
VGTIYTSIERKFCTLNTAYFKAGVRARAFYVQKITILGSKWSRPRKWKFNLRILDSAEEPIHEKKPEVKNVVALSL